MNDLMRFPAGLLWAASLALWVCAGGCGRPSARIELISYKDPYFPEPYAVQFAECAYQIDACGDYHIVGRATDSPGNPGNGAITQLLHVHLFWKPTPGKTFADETSNDATIRYAIITDSGTAVYAGTGFVYPKHRWFDSDVVGKLECAQLRLESQFGDAPDLLGDTRLTGILVAEQNRNLTVEVRRELELHAAGALHAQD
jgi:hypothetical protein